MSNSPTEKEPGMLRALYRLGRKEIRFSAVLSMFINILALTLPLYMLQIFSHVLVSESVPTLVVVTLLAVAAIVAWGILSEVRSRLLHLLGDKVDLLFGERVHTAMIAQAVKSSQSRTAGALRELATFRNFIGGQQSASLFDLPWTPLFLMVIWVLSPVLGVFATAGAVGLVVLAWVNDVFTREPERLAGKSSETELAFALAGVRNAEAVEGMGMRAAVVDRWQKQHFISLGYRGLGLRRGGAVASLSKSFRMLLQILIFGLGAYLAVTKQIGYGAMMGTVYLLSRALAPVDSAIGMWRQLVAAQTAYSRITELLAAEGQRSYGLRLPRPTGQLTVQNVVFGRPGYPPILKGVSFSAAAGDIVGIVGPSASGKSTLAKLLVGVWRPVSGIVRIDGADVANWDPQELGRHLGYLPQEVELFAGTVRDNISRLSNASDEDVVAAAQVAGAHSMILKLPKGYDTEIGDGGAVLSGGQRQRIGLARALLGSPALVVLDEPNANLDGPGEEALVAALTQAKSEGSTVVLITHKPALLFAADKVLVLNGGVVEKFGTRNDILPQIIQPSQKRQMVGIDDKHQHTG